MSGSTTPWSQVVADFRRVCLLRHQGRLDEADGILNGVLPTSIAAWSQSITQDAATKRKQLQDMFEAEERRMEETWAIRDLIFEDLKSSLILELKSELSRRAPAAELESSRTAGPAAPSQREAEESGGASRNEEAPPVPPVVRPWRPQRIQRTPDVLSGAPPVRPGFDKIQDVLDRVLQDQGTPRSHPPNPRPAVLTVTP